MRINVKTSLLEGDENILAIQEWAYGNALFDLGGGFQVGADAYVGSFPKRAACLHLVDKLPDGVEAKPTGMKSFFGQDVPSPNYILIEDVEGRLFDYHDCRQNIETLHVLGVLFEGPKGSVWFASHDGNDSSKMAAEKPDLVQISGYMHPSLEAMFGSLRGSLPASGEFQLTREQLPQVGYIPWWSGFGSQPDDGLSFPVEDAFLRTLVARAESIAESHGLQDDPDPSRKSLNFTLHDWQQDSDASLDLSVTFSGEQIAVSAGDGREVVLEVEDDVLCVRGYNATSDGPASMEIAAEAAISVDARAHLSEAYDRNSGMEP